MNLTQFIRDRGLRYITAKKGIYWNAARAKWAKECMQGMKRFDGEEKQTGGGNEEETV